MDDMLETMYNANGIGLAAIQIGVPKRIIVMDISANSAAEHCCICLERDDIVSCCFRDKIRHIPCNCNMYCHKYCFEKTNTTKCMICKQEYLVSWGQDPNKPKKKNHCNYYLNNLNINYFD